jgi:hypothetical protein
VCKPDRLARSTADLLGIVSRLEAAGVGLIVLSMDGTGLDTSTATGKLMVTMLDAIAAFERDLMLERQREGIAKAKAEGRYKGRAPTARTADNARRSLPSRKLLTPAATPFGSEMETSTAVHVWVRDCDRQNSQEAFACVPLEQVRPTHIRLHRLDAAVARDLHYREHVGASLSVAGQESRPQRVPSKDLRIQPGCIGVSLDDERDGLRRQRT